MNYHVDGELVPADEATVSVRDRGFRYGDAAVEAVRVYGGRPFRWDAHLDRLHATCDRIGIDATPTDADLRERVRATLDANDLRDAAVRISITRGVDAGGLTPPADPDPTVVVTTRALPRGGVDGTTPWDGPATLQTAWTRRPDARARPPEAATHSHLDGVLARRELHDADEALLLDGDGRVAEGATCSVFFVDDEALHTPGLDGPVRPRAARSLVLELAADEGVPVREGRYDPSDVRGADEAFVASATREVRPVGVVDGIELDRGPVTTLLARRYDRLVERTCYAADAPDRPDGPTN